MDQVTELSIPITEGQRKIKEYGFREVTSSNEKAVIHRADMPWLPSQVEAKIVPLAEVTLQDGKKFLYGSAIEEETLQEMAEGLGEDSEQANKLFYAEVQRYLENQRGTKMLDNAKSRRNIRYASNGRGTLRTYFMQMDRDTNTGLPVIIRVATCKGKGNEIDVLSVITTENRRTIKQRCLGK